MRYKLPLWLSSPESTRKPVADSEIEEPPGRRPYKVRLTKSDFRSPSPSDESLERLLLPKSYRPASAGHSRADPVLREINFICALSRIPLPPDPGSKSAVMKHLEDHLKDNPSRELLLRKLKKLYEKRE